MTSTVYTNADPGPVFSLGLPWEAPPLTLNDRMHHRPKADLTREVRRTAVNLAAVAAVPAMTRPMLTLVWLVTTRHKRDVDNIVPTLKALADGIVDAGVAVDDTPEFMAKAMPIIHYAKGHHRAPGMTLLIWEAGEMTPDERRAIESVGVAL